MLVIFDPNRSPEPAVSAVRRVLNLSEAEARLVCELFTGITLREAAENLQRSINTCKAQLKSIYSKTGCASHVDLVKATFFAASTTDGRPELEMSP
jgi:DNA-binding CsgD family transcriptional regulator